MKRRLLQAGDHRPRNDIILGITTTPQDLAYTEIQKLVTNFKTIPGPQRIGMNDMQTRLGLVLAVRVAAV